MSTTNSMLLVLSIIILICAVSMFVVILVLRVQHDPDSPTDKEKPSSEAKTTATIKEELEWEDEMMSNSRAASVQNGARKDSVVRPASASNGVNTNMASSTSTPHIGRTGPSMKAVDAVRRGGSGVSKLSQAAHTSNTNKVAPANGHAKSSNHVELSPERLSLRRQSWHNHGAASTAWSEERSPMSPAQHRASSAASSSGGAATPLVHDDIQGIALPPDEIAAQQAGISVYLPERDDRLYDAMSVTTTGPFDEPRDDMSRVSINSSSPVPGRPLGSAMASGSQRRRYDDANAPLPGHGTPAPYEYVKLDQSGETDDV